MVARVFRYNYLLGFGEVVFRVSVEDELSDVDEWVVSVRPNLGDIKNVPPERKS